MNERPAGDPRTWTPLQWLKYNAWEAAQPEPPQYGPYENAQRFYSSDEWLKIVRNSYESFKVDLGVAKRIGDVEAVKFYKHQIEACEQDLGLKPAQPTQERLFT